MTAKQCPFCLAEVDRSAKKCRHCGEWLPAAQQSSAAPATAAPVPVDDSPTFAIVTLVLWFVVSPVGLLLNVIGVFTGPRRGCFAAMLFVFVALPTLGAVIAFVANPEIGHEISALIDGFIEWLRNR